MTDNKLWDTIINPNADIEIIKSNNGLYRGIKISFMPSEIFSLNIKTDKIIVERVEFNDIGTNYKKARLDMIKEIRKLKKNS